MDKGCIMEHFKSRASMKHIVIDFAEKLGAKNHHYRAYLLPFFLKIGGDDTVHQIVGRAKGGGDDIVHLT